MARFQQKLQEKPGVKKYTIKDYRNLKKEIEIKEATDTGKLGFDAQNENYRRKVSIIMIIFGQIPAKNDFNFLG